MKKFKLSMMILMSMLVFSACGGGGGGSDDPKDPGDDPKDPTATLEINGDTYTYTLPGGTEFNLMLTPDVAVTNTFPTDTNDSGSANVPSRFIMGETEVTYQLWKEVHDWAIANGYTFANAGVKGNDGADGKTTQHPVTEINWRDSIVWCNALTEYYNANNGSETDLAVVYCSDAGYTTPIRSSADGIYDSSVNSTAGSYDNPYVNSSAKGFRLPGSMEWEFAGRYRGADATNAVAGSDGTYYTKGNSASGASADYSDESATSAVAVYGVSSTAVVKSKVSGANALGLYDMSGNVWEWCFDWYPSYVGSFRVRRGGACDNVAVNMRLSGVGRSDPYDENSRLFGFRFCRSR
ncbi:MAG TPA: SUMF1/EgtB/PvdO family nonheme iron enzyme [Spirochaetota bacterium]|nr:SUMF1/EgtB/PvdO family nonheme iron enzyme [Spirochaetota bacterium]HPM33998.1 SUMF1/EgtB/PvdO family nonheme iron enzyme [Spirochaetota bacterium]